MSTATNSIKGTYLLEGQGQKEARANEWFDQLAENIAGYLAIDVAGSGDYTLTNTVAGEAHHAMLKFTGALTGDRTILLPAASRRYLVYDGTSRGPANTLTFKTASGAGAALPVGAWGMVICDGLDCFALLTPAPAAATDPGTPGQYAWDASYFYICVAVDEWKRVAISTW